VDAVEAACGARLKALPADGAVPVGSLRRARSDANPCQSPPPTPGQCGQWCMAPSDRFITFSQLSIGLAA